MLKNDVAFFTKCSLEKYLIKTFLRAESFNELKDSVEFDKFTAGLISTIAEENKKKSWIVVSFIGENWDLALTISSDALKLPLSDITELFNLYDLFKDLLLLA